MNIFDFITQEELDDLPEDDAEAFVEFVRHAQRRLDARLEKLDTRDEDGWHLLNDARHGFMNIVIAAGKRYEVAPFSNRPMPLVENFRDQDYLQFKADLDHYLTQMILDVTLRNKRDGVLLAPTTKDKIRSYVHGLKTTIDQSEFSDAKRAALLSKISEFEAQLDKRRLSLMAVTRLTIAVLSVPGALWASADLAIKLTNNIQQVVGEAKAAEDENRRLPSQEPKKALLPPRTEEEESHASRRKSAAEAPAAFQRDEMDDEIPF